MLERVRELRLKFGYTQVELSSLSGVSLPTIQNIEAGIANPSYEVIQLLGRVLGFKMDLLMEDADWDYLIFCGMPLSVASDKEFIFNESLFISEIKKACLKSLDSMDYRKKEALQSFLIALQKHFPSWFKKHLSRTHSTSQLLKGPFNGKILKLSRQATHRLSEIL